MNLRDDLDAKHGETTGGLAHVAANVAALSRSVELMRSEAVLREERQVNRDRLIDTHIAETREKIIGIEEAVRASAADRAVLHEAIDRLEDSR